MLKSEYRNPLRSHASEPERIEMNFNRLVVGKKSILNRARIL